MDKIKSFDQFLNEAQFNIKNPGEAADVLANIIKANRNVKETPKGSNAGTEVAKYLKSVGLPSGLPWCAAFVYYIFSELSKKLSVPNPLAKTGGVMQQWESASNDIKITADRARTNHKLIRPGQVFIMRRPGRGLGHMGIVINVNLSKGTFTSIEGNTNDKLSGEGDRVGVNVRRIDSKDLVGFIDYFKNQRDAGFENKLSKAVDGKASMLPPVEGGPEDDVVGKGEFGSAGDDAIDKSFGGMLLSTLGGKDLTVGEVSNMLSKLR